MKGSAPHRPVISRHGADRRPGHGERGWQPPPGRSAVRAVAAPDAKSGEKNFRQGREREAYFSIDSNTNACRSASVMTPLSQVMSSRTICPAPLRSIETMPRFTGLALLVHS